MVRVVAAREDHTPLLRTHFILAVCLPQLLVSLSACHVFLFVFEDTLIGDEIEFLVTNLAQRIDLLFLGVHLEMLLPDI